jgi:hypothetical protein
VVAGHLILAGYQEVKPDYAVAEIAVDELDAAKKGMMGAAAPKRMHLRLAGQGAVAVFLRMVV